MYESTGLNEVRVGRFKLRFPPTPYPDMVPVTEIRVAVGNNIELVFGSKVAASRDIIDLSLS